MKTFGSNDIVFARASVMGRELLNVRICGAESMSALISAIRRQLGSYIGMVSLQIRNLTQGWSHQRTYVIQMP